MGRGTRVKELRENAAFLGKRHEVYPLKRFAQRRKVNESAVWSVGAISIDTIVTVFVLSQRLHVQRATPVSPSSPHSSANICIVPVESGDSPYVRPFSPVRRKRERERERSGVEAEWRGAS